MGYVFNLKDVRAYEAFCHDPHHQSGIELKNQLVMDLLNPLPGEAVLDIGCGTGENLVMFLEKGIQATGLDPSPHMLNLAHTKVAHRVPLYRGFAEDLPFDDNSFNHACFITTLEFVEDPVKALKEACRIAKDRLFIGVMNRYAIEGITHRVKGIFSESIYNHARFFSVWELKLMVHELLGDVPVKWRTVCQLPPKAGRFVSCIERSKLVQRVPFGTFAGMVVTLVPRFRTRPLALRYHPNQTPGAVPG